MKKLLITSALVVAGTSAFADGHVSISGNAEMGLAFVDTVASATDGDVTLHQNVNAELSFSGETDGGLSFGGSVEITDAANNGASVGDISTGTSVFISGDFGTLTMGDTDGAMDWAMAEVGSGTAIADDHTAHAGYSGNGFADGFNTLRYDNTIGDFGFAISVGNIAENSVVYGAAYGGATTDSAFGLGFNYSADLGGTTLGIGVGYTDAGVYDAYGISLSAGFGAVSAVVNFSVADPVAAALPDVEHMAIGLSYAMDALSVHVNYGEYDIGGVTTDGVGANVNFDLGGGAVLALGYGTDDAADRGSLGIRMDF